MGRQILLFRLQRSWPLRSALCGLALCVVSLAQTPTQPVNWSASFPGSRAERPGDRVTLDLSAALQEGWHVYGLTQVAGGPTPLRVAIDANDVVELAGVTSASAPVKKHDPSFDLDTQTYTQPFMLHIEVQVKPQAEAGQRTIPLSIRYQACTDRTCMPPKTIHIAVPIEILQSR